MGLRDYGVPGQIGLEKSIDEYVDTMVRVFGQVRRVLTNSGTCWLNLGDSYARDAGASFRAYGMHARGSNPKVTGRNGRIPSVKRKDLMGIPWSVALALRADGWLLRQDIVWHKPNPLPESVRDRPTRSHEYVFMLTKSEHYWYDAVSGREPSVSFLVDKRYGPGASGRDRSSEAWNLHAPYKPHKGFQSLDCSAGRNARSVWTIPTAHFPGPHFAVFPEQLAERCLLLGCPPLVCDACGTPYVRTHQPESFAPVCHCGGKGRTGTVLDPFGGSGTTTYVAMRHNRDSIYIDINPTNANIALNRCGFAGPRLVDCHEFEVCGGSNL